MTSFFLWRKAHPGVPNSIKYSSGGKLKPLLPWQSYWTGSKRWERQELESLGSEGKDVNHLPFHRLCGMFSLLFFGKTQLSHSSVTSVMEEFSFLMDSTCWLVSFFLSSTKGLPGGEILIFFIALNRTRMNTQRICRWKTKVLIRESQSWEDQNWSSAHWRQEMWSWNPPCPLPCLPMES